MFIKRKTVSKDDVAAMKLPGPRNLPPGDLNFKPPVPMIRKSARLISIRGSCRFDVSFKLGVSIVYTILINVSLLSTGMCFYSVQIVGQWDKLLDWSMVPLYVYIYI